MEFLRSSGGISYLKKIGKKILHSRMNEEIMVRAVCHMAQTGEGTDSCLRHGCLPLPVNFYSPVPDIDDLEKRKVWDRISSLEGIDFRPDAQEELLLALGNKFGAECGWPAEGTSDPHDFYTENMSFSYGCAASLHAILRHFKPGRIIEVGSGFSSLVISAALQHNEAEGSKSEYTIIDPYPREIIRQGLTGLTRLTDERVELMEVEFFDSLEENDVLFIDSGHTVRIGSDVNYLILDILPRLAPGVIVHLHDITLPYEYPKAYATNPSFRMFWTEAYLLQSFLSHNDEFEILLAMAYLMIERKEAFCAAFPLYNPDIHKSVSGSFWIRRKANSRVNRK